ncbi:MAG: hypothetical protein EKK65_08380 [Lysobacterales bacterium]|nr:MAG: hypothetical protein EKK65_08380 [Xanthomonadales bacterium]
MILLPASFRRLLAAALCAVALPACSTPPIQDSNIVAASYTAADQLISQASWIKREAQPVLVASLVNINALESSSAFGRITSEQISSRLAQQGLTVIEMKTRNNVFIEQDNGEFVLSRSVRDLSRTHRAAALAAGTYAIGRESVYVSTRLIRALDGVVIASYDYTLPLGPDTRALLSAQ